MTFKEKISLIAHCCTSIGVLETFKALARYTLRYKDSSFDRRNSIDTGDGILARGLGNVRSASTEPRTQYMPRYRKGLSDT